MSAESEAKWRRKETQRKKNQFFLSLTTGRVFFLVSLQRDWCRSNHSGFVISCRFAVGVEAAAVVDVGWVEVVVEAEEPLGSSFKSGNKSRWFELEKKTVENSFRFEDRVWRSDVSTFGDDSVENVDNVDTNETCFVSVSSRLIHQGRAKIGNQLWQRGA